MKRWSSFSLVLFVALSAQADNVSRPVAAAGDLRLLTAAQREWLTAFQTGASANTAADADAVAAAAWLDRAASGARDAKLGHTGDYLATVARVLRGEATVEDAEKAWRRTLDDCLFVIVRFDGGKIANITIATCDPARARAVEREIDRFERGLPGFIPSWIDASPTRTITRIANLHYRAGRNADTPSTGTYLPFDTTLTPAVGRTWVVYENMIRANWWGERLRPVALRILPNDAAKASAEAMIAWYGHRAPLYNAGPNYTPAQRERLGASKDPLSIIKGDLLPVLLAGAGDESIATLVNVSFDTLRELKRGNAPPLHKPATTTELNWLIERGALRFDEPSVTWRIDFERARPAVRALAKELFAIEAAGDANRAAALFTKYGAPAPAIDKTVASIDALPLLSVQAVFVNE